MPKKKAGKKTSAARRIFPQGNKKVSNANKQRQAVNVKIKIDQSRRTNPREPRVAAKGSLPSRAYTANSLTPLHTTIMTATPSPAIIQKEPNYAETINNMFKDAEMKSNRQLTLLTNALEEKDEQVNELVRRVQQPSVQDQYKALMAYHQSKLTGNADVEEMPDEVSYQGLKDFQDPNAKAASKLKTPPAAPPAEESTEEDVLQEPKSPVQPKETMKPRKGRPKDTEEQKALKALVKEEARKKIQYENLKKVANTRANRNAGLSSPLVGLKPEAKAEEKITHYFRTQKEEAEEQIKIKALQDKINEEVKLKREARRSARKKRRETAKNKKFGNLFAQTSDDEN